MRRLAASKQASTMVSSGRHGVEMGEARSMVS